MNHKIRLAHRIAIDGLDFADVVNETPVDREVAKFFHEAKTSILDRIGDFQVLIADSIVTGDKNANIPKHTIFEMPCCTPPFSNCIVEWVGPELDKQTHTNDRWEFVGNLITVVQSKSEPSLAEKIEVLWVAWNKEWRRPRLLPAANRLLLDVNGRCCDLFLYGHEDLLKDGKMTQQPIVSGLTMSFLTCKNVSTVVAPHEMLPDEKWQRRQAGKIKGLTFKTLKIDGLGSGPRSPSGEPSGAHNSFHICRGNFAEYTAEKPLFGKYVGRFWRPAHVKGSKEVGVVEKDYSIEPADRSFDASTDGQ